MLRRLFLIAALGAAAFVSEPALAQRPPSREEISRLERTIANRIDDSTGARNAANRLTDGDSEDERENAEQRVRDANVLLGSARDSLAAARQRLAEAAEAPPEDRTEADERTTSETGQGSSRSRAEADAEADAQNAGLETTDPAAPWYANVAVLGL
ncbi:MAG TPA: hypothetical protein VF594_06490, partial [Rubricoccaceae bacterium]